MPFSREKYSKTRSRPRHDCAYSPIGPVGSVSMEPEEDVSTSGYTLPVEKTTMREDAKRRATWVGRTVLCAQVRSGRPAEPNT